MGLYDRHVLPRVVHFTCGLKPNMRQRSKVVPAASGEVLEIGFGTGLNLPYYDAAKVTRLYALEPSAEMLALARPRLEASPIPVEPILETAERMPLAPASVDTVVLTYTLCTIPGVAAALERTREVLRPGGRVLFCEHGAAPDEKVLRWQNRLDALWSRLGGGCHLNRPIPTLLEQGGFRVEELSTMYLPGWKPATFNYWGMATLS